MDLKKFGERVSAERERLGLKPVDVYTPLGIHRNSQSDYEKGRKEPGISYLVGLMVLGFDVVWLLRGNDAGDAAHIQLTEQECTLLRAYRRLPSALALSVLKMSVEMDIALESINPIVPVSSSLSLVAAQKSEYGTAKGIEHE